MIKIADFKCLTNILFGRKNFVFTRSKDLPRDMKTESNLRKEDGPDEIKAAEQIVEAVINSGHHVLKRLVHNLIELKPCF